MGEGDRGGEGEFSQFGSSRFLIFKEPTQTQQTRLPTTPPYAAPEPTFVRRTNSRISRRRRIPRWTERSVSLIHQNHVEKSQANRGAMKLPGRLSEANNQTIRF